MVRDIVSDDCRTMYDIYYLENLKFNQESCMISVHWTNDQPVKVWCYCSDSTIQGRCKWKSAAWTPWMIFCSNITLYFLNQSFLCTERIASVKYHPRIYHKNVKNSYYGDSLLSREATWTKDCYNTLSLFEVQIGIRHLAMPNYDWPVYTVCKIRHYLLQP